MGKEQTPRTNKAPKTVQIKLLVPWAIIALMIVGTAAFITGWHVHQSYNQSMQAEFARGVASKGQQ